MLEGGDAAFFACWTRKEAVLKACGTGLLTPLADVHVGAGPAIVPRVRIRAGTGLARAWSQHAGVGPGGCAVAAAVPRSDVALSAWSGRWSGSGD